MGELKVNAEKKKEAISNEDLANLLRLIENVKFGSVTLVIQDGRVVQIEKNEKIRLV